jgi:hypothetical protein
MVAIEPLPCSLWQIAAPKAGSAAPGPPGSADVTDSGVLAYSPVEAVFTARRAKQIGSAHDGCEPMMEQSMMESLLNCSTNGWLMIAGGVVTYGVLILAGVVLVKHLFSAERGHAANS